MDVGIQTTFATADISACLSQLDAEFGSRLRALASEHPPFARMPRLSIFMLGSHPLSSAFQEPGRGSFSKANQSYFVGALVDYRALASSHWAARVEAYAEAAARAARKTAKTRIAENERYTLLQLIESARAATAAAPPASLALVGPVFIRDPASATPDTPLISFGDRPIPGMIEVRPSEIDKYAQLVAAASAPTAEAMFKLYATREGQLLYREAWIDDRQTVHEHQGAVGARGQHAEHGYNDAVAAQATYQRLKQGALDDGYERLAPSRHATLVVEYSSRDTSVDLARRHAIENFLNELTGWLGLGHVDGGSIGSGTMEVFCVVVNFAIARDAIADALSKSRFADFSRIYRMK